jgi:hypothetical protein
MQAASAAAAGFLVFIIVLFERFINMRVYLQHRKGRLLPQKGNRKAARKRPDQKSGRSRTLDHLLQRMTAVIFSFQIAMPLA